MTQSEKKVPFNKKILKDLIQIIDFFFPGGHTTHRLEVAEFGLIQQMNRITHGHYGLSAQIGLSRNIRLIVHAVQD